ncbi:MAG: hypothetical protein COU11_03255 [Candidatus Harrisonbacteria bacterium CG10_big_fil_rev_8_21_14_0_10_49_15]|uniref:Uncharacterized protein n=1 Tax=Candidatus Harrisonbacteria bacterium CG10_big_fil_rev_8_21_14_0_10_49_15 TaxID=1974587 RepID=A0A2H0UKB6_9BACT|nr:MAG: hypothetical protein COU11_03255 [Candidatus Harrisonbacteria bacterium CG10_big_fil_rev_8_21_14_0_10_49_15]
MTSCELRIRSNIRFNQGSVLCTLALIPTSLGWMKTTVAMLSAGSLLSFYGAVILGRRASKVERDEFLARMAG